MRKIIFRAWHKTNKCMVDWKFLQSVRYGGNKLNNRKEHDSMFNDPDYILQYGFEYIDRNGHELYESDIVTDTKFKDWKSELLWNDFGVELKTPHPQGKTLSELVFDHTERLEIIGNIYDNPELLF